MKKLSQLAVGECARVTSFEGGRNVDQRLMVMGLIPGVDIRLVQVAPFGDPIAVEFDGRRVSLRKQEAERVFLNGVSPSR